DKLSEIETGSVDSRPWVVINKAKVVLGLVDQAIWSRHKAARAEEIMDPAPVTYRPNTTIEQAAAFMSKHSLSSVLVTTSDGELLGAVDRPIVEHAVDETGPQM
ncbi:MAG TPA: CBS domain-containing protein, partial [Terriglobales bacterium]|nr:CBS domain-containing protein [Terriglobales bacterium]